MGTLKKHCLQCTLDWYSLEDYMVNWIMGSNSSFLYNRIIYPHTNKDLIMGGVNFPHPLGFTMWLVLTIGLLMDIMWAETWNVLLLLGIPSWFQPWEEVWLSLKKNVPWGASGPRRMGDTWNRSEPSVWLEAKSSWVQLRTAVPQPTHRCVSDNFLLLYVVNFDVVNYRALLK